MDDELVPAKDGRNESSVTPLQAFDVSPLRPGGSAFRPYTQSDNSSNGLPRLRVVVAKPLIVKLTNDIVETFVLCNPKFKYSEEWNPKRFLTSPSLGVLNDGFDNVNSDLILAANDVLVNSDCKLRYIVKDVLGHGTFGQVAKCWAPERNSFVAVKIIKNQPAYYQQALVEVSILKMLNKNYDQDDQHHIVRIYDYFVHQHHLCISFELLDSNLYEHIKLNNFKGLSLNVVQLFSKQILHALAVMRDAGVIHCDLKPENILLCLRKQSEIKVIDFGSACMEHRTVYSYIQSRYYRSPEVVLGYQYTTAIDMWSFGCIVAELFLGLPLFPGASEFDLLRRMIKILGGQPPDHVLKDARYTSKYFKCIGTVHFAENGNPSITSKSAFQVLNEEEYEAREMKKPLIGKEYFSHMDLKSLVSNYPYRKNLPEEDMAKESQMRLALLDFLRGLVEFDPAKRWSPFQASKHPFITGEPFTCPYIPPPEIFLTPHQGIKINHHPGAGHWFAAGLSPNMMGLSHVVPQGSPYFPMVPIASLGSHGGVGSSGGHNDVIARRRFNSVGDNKTFSYFSPVSPSGSNFRAKNGVSMLGNSPEARHMFLQHSNRNGLGVSPSSGNFTHMPLGSSPSQFTPPNYCHFSNSPAQYSPTSFARGNFYGSPLGKMTASSHFSRQKGSYSGSLPLHETSLPQRHGNFVDNSSGKVEGSCSWHPQLKCNTSGSKLQYRFDQSSPGYSSMVPNRSFGYGTNSQFLQEVGAAPENAEAIQPLPDPGDWDPNYSDELLLQDDDAEMSSLPLDFSKQMHIGQTTFYGNIRPNGQFQEFSQSEAGPAESFNSDSIYTHQTSAHSQQFVPQMRFSLTHLGQQSVQWLSPGNPGPAATYMREWRQATNIGAPQSPKSNSLCNALPWGLKSSHPVSRIPPATRGRKIT